MTFGKLILKTSVWWNDYCISGSDLDASLTLLLLREEPGERERGIPSRYFLFMWPQVGKARSVPEGTLRATSES